MRKVTYFSGGRVADFLIPDDRYGEFSRMLPFELRQSDKDLEKARKALAAFIDRNTGAPAGPQEILAACFVWNFFNTNPDDEGHIDGDIMIVDLAGDGETIEYASPEDIDMRPEASQ